jgi:hypothetical protein
VQRIKEGTLLTFHALKQPIRLPNLMLPQTTIDGMSATFPPTKRIRAHSQESGNRVGPTRVEAAS